MRGSASGMSSREAIDDAGAVESVQRIALPRPVVPATDAGARELGRRYWADVQRSMRGLVRVRHHAGGTDVLLGGRLALLRFGPPRLTIEAARVACSYDIVGGALAARSAGTLAVEQRGGPAPELVLAVSGYHPRLAGLWRPVYRRLQAPLHRAICRRFLGRATAGRGT